MVCFKVAKMIGSISGREVTSVEEWKKWELRKLGKWEIEIWCGEVSRDTPSVQIYQKKILVHENRHDKRHKYVEMWGQENDNQDERSYSLRTHMERNQNPTNEHDMEADTESKDTQIYAENYNQEYDEKDTQTWTFFRIGVGIRLKRYTKDSNA